MQLDITGHHVEVTEPLRDYVISKLEKMARKFMPTRQKKACMLPSTGSQTNSNDE